MTPAQTQARAPIMTDTNTAIVTTPTRPEGLSGRRFFEVFGDALTENLFLRNLVVVLGGSCILLCVAVARLAGKPPLVIRVDNIGEPMAFANVKVQNAVTGPEVRNFAEHFTRYLLAWDLYTQAHDIDTAFRMMTPTAAQRMFQKLNAMNAEPFAKDHAVRTTIQIVEIDVEKDTPEIVRVKLRGTRTYSSYTDKDFKKETTFEDTFVARKVDRSLKTPWGLLVDDWQESIFKETP
jgi:type IV secretory pathway TrbF-like protein